jgi:hypothetical protein
LSGYGQERGKDAQFGVRNARNYVAENKKGLPVGQAFDVVSTFRTALAT